MHRVVTKTRRHDGMWIIEFGPWLPSLENARTWARTLQDLGYIVRLENMRGEVESPG